MLIVCWDGGRAPTFLSAWPVVERYANVGCVVYGAKPGVTSPALRSFRGMLAQALSTRKFRDPTEDRVETALRVVSDGSPRRLDGDLDLMLRQDVANLRVDLKEHGVHSGSAAELMLVKYFRMLWLAASPTELLSADRAAS